jgi:hypothetical protein
MDGQSLELDQARQEVERLARAGASIEQIKEALEVRSLAPSERELLDLYARRISNRSSGVGGERYLASLENEIGA